MLSVTTSSPATPLRFPSNEGACSYQGRHITILLTPRTAKCPLGSGYQALRVERTVAVAAAADEVHLDAAHGPLEGDERHSVR